MNLSAQNIILTIRGLAILRDIDLEIEGGKTTVLLGPNGAGKSTLLKVFSGYLSPTNGQILVDGDDIKGMSLKTRAKMFGVLTQKSNLDFPFTAREVVAMGRTPFVLSDGYDSVTEELMEKFDVEADQSYLAMSGGAQQLVQLCRVFSQVWGRNSKAFILLDEPMTGLDLRHQSAIASTLKEFSGQGIGQLVVMHDINLAHELADEVVLMSHGQVVSKGPALKSVNVDSLERTFETTINQIGEGSARYFRAKIGT